MFDIGSYVEQCQPVMRMPIDRPLRPGVRYGHAGVPRVQPVAHLGRWAPTEPLGEDEATIAGRTVEIEGWGWPGDAGLTGDEGDATALGGAGLEGSLAAVEQALDGLAAAEVADEHNEVLSAASVRLQELADRVAAQQLRVLGVADRRTVHLDDGAVSMASWLRSRVRHDPGEAVRRVRAADRLTQLPALRQAFEAGEITWAHVSAVTQAAIPQRMRAIAQMDAELAELARHGQPQDLRRAVRMIADLEDADGSDAAKPESDPARGSDPRRGLTLSPTVDGLWDMQGTLDLLAGEGLAAVLEALEIPDPPDTPETQRRTAAQRRADALAALVDLVMDQGLTPEVGKVKPHLLLSVDLRWLLERADGTGSPDHTASTVGRDVARASGQVPATQRHGAEGDAADLARRSGVLNGPGAPWMPWSGAIDPTQIEAVLTRFAHMDAKVTMVATMGPWRPVSVGRTQRVLPGWLRPVLARAHQRCRGPDCDRPVGWTQAHHVIAWADSGQTDVVKMLPLCVRHHDLVTNGGWDVQYEPDTGVCAWTAPDGRGIPTYPPGHPARRPLR